MIRVVKLVPALRVRVEYGVVSMPLNPSASLAETFCFLLLTFTHIVTTLPFYSYLLIRSSCEEAKAIKRWRFSLIRIPSRSPGSPLLKQHLTYDRATIAPHHPHHPHGRRRQLQTHQTNQTSMSQLQVGSLPALKSLQGHPSDVPHRRKKARCSGEHPICAFCRRLSQTCYYSDDGDSDKRPSERPSSLKRKSNADSEDSQDRVPYSRKTGKKNITLMKDCCRMM